MAIRDIYESGFDEVVQTDLSTNQCLGSDGHVTAKLNETV
jgi:transcription initiation factor TFIIB